MWWTEVLLHVLLLYEVAGAPQAENTPELVEKAPANHESDYDLWDLYSSTTTENPDGEVLPALKAQVKVNWGNNDAAVSGHLKALRQHTTEPPAAPVKSQAQGTANTGGGVQSWDEDDWEKDTQTSDVRKINYQQAYAPKKKKKQKGRGFDGEPEKEATPTTQKKAKKIKGEKSKPMGRTLGWDEEGWEEETKSSDVRTLNYQQAYKPAKSKKVKLKKPGGRTIELERNQPESNIEEAKKKPTGMGRSMGDDENGWEEEDPNGKDAPNMNYQQSYNPKAMKKGRKKPPGMGGRSMVDDGNGWEEDPNGKDAPNTNYQQSYNSKDMKKGKKKPPGMGGRTMGDQAEFDDSDWEDDPKAKDAPRVNYQQGYNPKDMKKRRKKPPGMEGRSMGDQFEPDDGNWEDNSNSPDAPKIRYKQDTDPNDMKRRRKQKGQRVVRAEDFDSDLENHKEPNPLKANLPPVKELVADERALKYLAKVKRDINDMRFVVVEKLSTGEEVERPFEFDVGGMLEEEAKSNDNRRRRQEEVDNPKQNPLNMNSSSTPVPTNMSAIGNSTITKRQSPPQSKDVEIVNAAGKKFLQRMDNDTVEKLGRLPDIASGTMYVQYSAFEPAGDNGAARPGDSCTPKTIYEPDSCELAAYPNKNKLFCYSSGNDTNYNLTSNTCACKFFRATEGTEATWKQPNLRTLNINGQEVKACMVPKFGVCNHRIPTGLTDQNKRPIYEVDVCQGHFQCDNTDYLDKIGNKIDGVQTQAYILQKNCSEQDFLDQFQQEVRSQVLVCSKPKSRRFKNYNEYKYYCLPQDSRDEEQKHVKSTKADQQDDSEDASLIPHR